MRVTARVNIRHFGDMVRHIQAKTGKVMEEILEKEATTILNTMIRLAPGATRESIFKDFNTREWVTMRGKKYRIAGEGRYGTQKKDHKNRYDDLLWAGIQSKRNESLARKIIRRGLVKQSWFQIAEAIGLHVKAPPYVRKARGRKGPIVTGTGYRRGPVSRRVFTLLNNSFIAGVTGGRKLLNQVINRRVRQYRRGIIEEMKKLAAQAALKSPGAKVT